VTLATISALNIYPLKSARGIPRSQVRLWATGFEWDRHWLIVDAKHHFITQRTHPQLARIETAVTEQALTLSAPQLAPFVLSTEPAGTPVRVQIWKDTVDALDQGATAAAWVSEAVGEALRLVRVPSISRRLADQTYTGTEIAPVAFADGYPVLICNRASLEDLNTRLPEPLPMERFRPNLVLEGLPAFAEDRIASIRIDDVTLALVKPCTRCVITSTDQRTGIRSNNPLPVLRTFRYDSTLHGVKFGENAIVRSGFGSTLERGAQCTVDFDN